MKKQKEVCRAVAVVDAKPAEPEVMPPLGKIEEPDYTRPAECINFHLGMAQHHGRIAIAHLIIAGQELAKQKQMLGYGGWNEFCEKELTISKITADRYVKFFYKVIVERRVAGIPFDKRVTNKELAEATVGMEGKSATRAMVDLGIIKRSGDWGGKDRGQGRKPKKKDEAADISAELDEVANSPALLIAAIREPIATVYKAWRERDVFAKINMSDLAVVAASLNELATAATSALKARSKK